MFAAGDTQAPVGVFDSGLGGLTVVRAIRARLPAERLVYLGDTARVPYGNRSPKTVIRYALRCADFLAKHRIKALVVACNTVSAVALEALQARLQVPVIGMIVPGAKAALAAAPSAKVGVLATEGTVLSGAYEHACQQLDSRAQVWTQAAPLLVPLVEEGWLDGTVPQLVIAHYLEALSSDIEVLLLGCTHYPLLRPRIEAVLKERLPHCQVVDSATAVATELATLWHAPPAASQLSLQSPPVQLYVTDLPERFWQSAGRFFGDSLPIDAVENIDL